MTLRPRSAMHRAQLAVSDLIVEMKAVGVFLEAGFGKTIGVGDACARLLMAEKLQRIFVFAPPRVAAGVWKRELAKWEHTAHINVIPVVGSAAERLCLLATPGPAIFCISLSLAQWVLSVAATIRAPQMLAVDESSLIKSPTAKVTQAIVSIARRCEYRVIMSGTPRPQGAHELWSQIYTLDFGQRLGKNYGDFLSRWFYQAGHYRIAARTGAIDAINAVIEDIVKTAKVDDYIDMPTLQRNVIDIELTPASRTIYDQLESDVISRVTDGRIKAVGSPVSQFGKLAQVANGCLYDHMGTWSTVGTEKLDALEELLGGTGEPALIFYRFIADREQILARLEGAEHFSAKTPKALAAVLDRWQRGEIRALVAHPRAIAHGIDGLQFGARHLVWYGMPLGSVEQMIQAEARLHRQGAIGTTFIHEIRTLATIDEPIAKTLLSRKRGQDDFMEALAEYLRVRHPHAPADLSKLLGRVENLER